MDQATRLRLNQINQTFYARAAQEFDATRRRAWPGWLKALSKIDSPIQSVIDIGCGNGRFALFLSERQPTSFDYTGIDSSPGLLSLARTRLSRLEQVRTRLIEHDLVEDELPDIRAQLVVLFGVLHHVPGFLQRRELLLRCAQLLAPGGHLVFAAWRFYEEERFRNRIVPWDSDLPVEKNDYLLDWRRGERALRYCHYVDDTEHDDLVAATGLSAKADFRADGASGTLNRYTVLGREEEG
ncbi:MAG: class I SAM-dependent methyltransferase [Chloroflexi bacterium]|nr:class I SAM-dependent methyltransferase [Chloroflexota bacterium]